MKKATAFILILSTLAAALLACTGAPAETARTEPETTGSETVTEAETKEETMTEEVTEEVTDEIIKAPDEDEGLNVWFTHSFTKTDPDRPADTGLRSYTVYMTRGEKEDAQIVISGADDKNGLSVECTPLKNRDGYEINTEILRQYYIKCKKKYIPDPIAPVNDTTRVFDVGAGRSQAMYVQLKTEKDTPAGDYSGVVSVKRDGKTVKQLRIFAHVWDIEMPESLSTCSVSGLGPGQLYRFHDRENGTDYYKEYYDYLLENNVNAYDLPYDVLDERADAYMSDPRVKFFRLSYIGDDGKMVAWYNKLKTNEEWFKKAYFYPYDEPGSVDSLNQMAGFCMRIRRLCPGIRIVVPFFQNVQYDNDRDQVAFMSEFVDIWCPKTFCYTKPEERTTGRRLLYNAKQRKQFPEFGERMKAEAEGGDVVWWYVCWEPGLPYLNMYVDMQGYMNRLLFWQQKQYNVDGFLYWSCNFWEKVENPWTNMATVGTDYRTGQKWLSDEVFGDGSLLYPGSEVGVDGACGSVRLECIRDGMEEFEMLTMLEAAAGREKVDEIISTVSENIVSFTKNEEDLAKARIELGNALEAALKK